MLGLGTGISHTKEEHILWRSSCYNHMLPFWNSSGGITCTRRHRWTYGDGWQKRGECQQTLGIHSAQFALALADSTNWPPMPFFMYCHQQKNDGHWPEQLQRQIIHQNAQIFHRNWLIPSPPAISQWKWHGGTSFRSSRRPSQIGPTADFWQCCHSTPYIFHV